MQTNKPLNVDDLPIIIRFYQRQNIKKAYRVTYRSKSGNEDFVGAKDKNEADKKVKEIEDSGHKIINVELLKAKVYVKNPAEAPKGVKIEEGPQGGHYYESAPNGTIQTNDEPIREIGSKEYLPKLKQYIESNLQTPEGRQKLQSLNYENTMYGLELNIVNFANLMINDEDNNIRAVAAKKADIEYLHKLINDKSPNVRYEVAQRIDQSGLHKMIRDISFEVRGIVTKRIDQSGLHEMINDSYSYANPTLKTIIAERINLDGLKKIRGIEGWISDYNIDSLIKRRIFSSELLESTIMHYNGTGEIVLDGDVINSIRNIMSQSSESTGIISLTDEFYNLINNGEFHQFHLQSKENWEQSSSSDLALLLKDSIKRQFGGEIRYHDEVKDIENKLNELYRRFPKEHVDKYIQIQKKLTMAYLDAMFPDTNEITIYRGTTRDESQDILGSKEIQYHNEVMVQSNPLSSWTLRNEIASRFASHSPMNGVILQMKVNKNDIWSTFMSHAYEGTEREILLIGNKDRKAYVFDLI